MNSAVDLSTLPKPKSMEEETLFQLYPLSPIRTKQQFDEYKTLLMGLIDLKRKVEPKVYDALTIKGKYLQQLAKLMKEFEEEKYGAPKKVSGIDLLKFLMDQNGLMQEDMKKELGPQSNVSEILRGKRHLTVDQIRKLSKRFKISSDAFMVE